MTAMWVTIVVVALITAVIKATGPVLLGGRDLPPRFTGVIVLMGPALLSALVVTNALAEGQRWQVDALSVGVVAAAVAAWRGLSAVWCVAIAVAVTAVLRLVG